MINAGFVDFLFTGTAILPEVLLLSGYIGEALLLLIPMLIGVCLLSVYYDKTAGSSAPDAAVDADDPPGLTPGA